MNFFILYHVKYNSKNTRLLSVMLLYKDIIDYTTPKQLEQYLSYFIDTFSRTENWLKSI